MDDDRSRLAEIVAQRRAQTAALRDAGVDPYPPHADVDHSVAGVRARWGQLDPGTDTGESVTVAGRLVGRRRQGRLSFGVLREDGVDVQLFLPGGATPAAVQDAFDQLDLGDWIAVSGEVVTTRRGELSIRPASLTLIGKALRPLPDKWHGLRDVEQRLRQRELDLAVNADTRRVFAVRSRVLRALRDEMDARGFVEVETPLLHPIPGGANATPFVTHHKALDMELYLRVAPELYLKRLVVGGMPRVYELNRSFRNEGIDRTHNPEYTMLEAYQAYADHDDVLALTEALVARAADAAGPRDLTYQGRPLTLDPPFARRTVLDLVRDAVGDAELTYDTPVGELRRLCDVHGAAWQDSWAAGRLVWHLYEELVEPGLWQPTFVTEHPLETSPLARAHRSKPHVAERFELLIAGREHANAFSELTDPDEQRARFEAQARLRRAGDDEAMVVDEAYLRAMEHGLPPVGGLGVGVDRLVMLLADVGNIRDVILFPTLRPEA